MKFLGIVKEKQSKNFYSSIEENPQTCSQNLLEMKSNITYKGYSHVRISEIATFCPREFVIGYLTGKQKEAKIDYPLMQQFELGSALHFWYQNFSPVFRKSLYGYWKCWACGNLRGRLEPLFCSKDELPSKCEHCGADKKASFYEELYFRIDKPYRVTGKIDGFLKIDDTFYIIDFKTYFTQEDFPRLKDQIQIMSYLYFYDYISNKPAVWVSKDKTYLFYISKKFSHSSSILTFSIQRDDKIIQPIIKNLEAFTIGVEKKILPDPLDDCIRSDWRKGKAKDCYLKDLCKEYFIDSNRGLS